MKKQVVVIGLGRFGSAVARELASQGHHVLVIDADAHAVETVAEYVTQAIQANATDEDTLSQLGVRDFDIGIVGIGSDIQASILVTVLLKRLGVARIIATAQNDLHGLILEKVGADRIVYPERDHGIKLAHSLANPDIQDYMELAPSFGISRIPAPKNFVGKTLEQAELDPKGKFGIVVLALRRGNRVILHPDDNEVIREGDILVLAGKDEGLEQLSAAATTA